MKATISKIDDVVVINLSGRINMEYTEVFREACLKEFPKRSKKLIFNLSELSFVGSNGIMLFVDTLKDLADSQQAVLRFCAVSSEFKKVFAASPLASIETFDNQDSAIASLRNLDFVESAGA
jgi:anti-anti-sigma factor